MHVPAVLPVSVIACGFRRDFRHCTYALTAEFAQRFSQFLRTAQSISQREGFVMMEDRRESHLIEPEWLESRLKDSGIRVVDMRGYVVTDTKPDGSQTADYRGAQEEYLESH